MTGFELSYRRAAFIAFEPGGYPGARRLIPFRFNPEGLSRTVNVQGGQKPPGVESGRGAAPPPSGEGAAARTFERQELRPARSAADASSDGTEPVRAASPRPTVLLVWGRRNVVPVRITSLKIDESVYNAELNPVRAEIEAALEVLGEAEAQADRAVRSALDKLHGDRRKLALRYYQNTSAQGSNILPL